MPQEVLADDKDFVSALRDGLAARIGRDRYELWFGSQVRWKFHGDTLSLLASSTFVLDRLRRQFAPDIRIAARIVFGDIVRTEFCVDEVKCNASACSVLPLPTTKSVSPADEKP